MLWLNFFAIPAAAYKNTTSPKSGEKGFEKNATNINVKPTL